MTGHPPLDMHVDRLPPSAVVADIVYAPLRTGFLEAAEQRGLRTADGLGMLLQGGARRFSLWFGVTPDVTPEIAGIGRS